MMYIEFILLNNGIVNIMVYFKVGIDIDIV